jgi:hypothetical protein
LGTPCLTSTKTFCGQGSYTDDRLILQAIDRVISLLRGRIDDQRRFVQEQVDPIFKGMEIIHQNYIQSFTDIIQVTENVNS